MNNDIAKILLDESQIADVVDGIAEKINKDYENEELVVVGILKGSIMFLADVFRKLEVSCSLDFMAASSYGSSTISSGKVTIKKDLSEDIKGKHVLIVEDILDTGNTLSYIKDYLAKKDPLSVKICTLFDKPSRRQKPISPDYVGRTIPDLFIVGYGLDYNEKYRNLPYIGVLKPEVYS
ncbi:MAG: hypoxanthine phosphoribosyltransferase [Acutalibacteraceae bacterium]